MEHITHVSREGNGYRVTCEKGCELGTSSLVVTATEANNRADLHQFAQNLRGTVNA